MLTKELTTQASLEVLAHTHLGRLGCARGMQPYIVPIHFSYHDHWLYCFSVLGQKIDWMRANPLVCIEADQMRGEQNTTVVVFGRYEELCDTPECRSERQFAFNLLRQRAMWWDHGGVRQMPAGTSATDPVFYRIKIEQITGRCAVSEQAGSDAGQANADRSEQGWLRKILQGVRQS